MTNVYFATNRKSDGTGKWGYGSQIVGSDANQITYARAQVDSIVLTTEGSGKIAAIEGKTAGRFSDAHATAIMGADKNLLVFIHGFANSFEASLTRSAFNREWFAGQKNPASDTTVISFSWPSSGALAAPPPYTPPDAYRADQARAGMSGFHIASFLAVMEKLCGDFKKMHPGRRAFLLVHSMGNYALQAGVQAWSNNRTATSTIFDEAFLPGADEVADTFQRPSGGRLSNLSKLANRISVYYSERDVAMYLSMALNLTKRLGWNGADDKRDTNEFPRTRFRNVDTAGVNDYDLFDPPDASHQYYRRSKKVRADIVAVMAKDAQVKGGVIQL